MLTLAFGIIAFVVFYQKRMLSHKLLLQEKEKDFQRQLTDASIEVVEQERKRIAANIHDEVMLDLGILKNSLSRVYKNPGDTALAERVLGESTKVLNDSIDTLRKISYDLMPPFLNRYGFVKAIRQVCHQVKDAYRINIGFSTNAEDLKSDEKTELQLYRLVKEVLNNVIKHAKASEVHVDMTFNNGLLLTTVSHNGIGITMESVKEFSETGKGIGLKSILSRAQLTDSIVQYIIVGSHEARITIETPVKEVPELTPSYDE